MGLTGSEVNETNFKLRFLVIIVLGILAWGSVMYWKSQELLAAEYQDMPVTKQQLDIKKKNELKKKSLQDRINSKYELDN